jgi:hypothetical protein
LLVADKANKAAEESRFPSIAGFATRKMFDKNPTPHEGMHCHISAT